MHTNKRIADIHASIGNDMFDLNGISKVFKGGNLTGATGMDLGKDTDDLETFRLGNRFLNARIPVRPNERPTVLKSQ